MVEPQADGARCRQQTLRCHEDLPDGWCRYADTVSGYRVLYSPRSAVCSMWDSRQNEYWMIWSDVFPCCLFVSMWASFAHSDSFRSMGVCQKIFANGVYFAVVSSRLCSAAYHTFNCLSLRMNTTLINLDLIGISNMAMACPWFLMFAVAPPRQYLHTVWLHYVITLAVLYAACIQAFAFALFTGNTSRCLGEEARRALLAVLALVGNFPAVVICTRPDFPPAWRILCGLGPASLALGYVCFYTWRLPHRFFPAGTFDSSMCNSHVLWHAAASVGQLCFLLTTFLPIPLRHSHSWIH